MDDPNNNKSFELDRSASIRASIRRSHIQGDDEDYDLQAMAVADGFRPVQVAQNHSLSHVPRPSTSSLEPPVARAVSPRPSSISKPHPHHESFSLQHDGVEQLPARSSSVSTNSTFMPTEIPYEGPSGPSHPYQMYPQNVRLARTASLATTSTAPVSERSYNGPRGPTHPYGIYPQNVTPEDDSLGDRFAQREVNVGFPGTADQYQRRLGPDGEEAADLIGPDGHTEQLPPYTRYPEEAYVQKALGIDISQPAPASPPVQPNLEIPGAGGIGLATRNPEFASTEDLNRLNSPRSIRSFNSDASHHSINTAALAVTNEKSRSKNWKAAARRKVWGIIPCWVVVLGVIVLVMFGVVVGTVIGIGVGPHLRKGPPHEETPYPVVTPNPNPYFVPLPTAPPDLPPLVEGPYSLPLFSPSVSNRCFQDTTQASAWNCQTIMSQLGIEIQKKQNANATAAYSLDFTFNSSFTIYSHVYTYGVQPPQLDDIQLELVNDKFEPQRGPAWAFAVPYNKTIILPEPFFSPPNNTSVHSVSSGDVDEMHRRMMFSDGFKRKGVAQAGEKPWICTWPGTILEVYIYAYQNSSFRYPSSGTSSPTSSSLPTSSMQGSQPTGVYRREAMEYAHNDEDGDDDNNNNHEGGGSPPYHHTTPPPTGTPASMTPTSTPSHDPSYFNPPSMLPPPIPPYPRVMKVDERRGYDSGQPAPVCRQFEIIGDGIPAKPVLFQNGEPVEIPIIEEMPESERKPSRLHVSRWNHLGRNLQRRDDPASTGNELSDCGCIWVIT
ncbi:hypothetical protein F5Y19DRAFT_19961 [Xylariaceae sp. FL1651]|nr:hypothetical protein F5Y19DRAFT_19961 [Xylariaceae sp. FL1651]